MRFIGGIFAICICIRRAINNFSFLSLFFPFWKSCCTQLSFSPPTPIGSPVTGLSQFECSCPTRYIPFEQTSFGEPDSLGARKRPEGTLARVIRNKVMRKVDVWKGMSDGVAQGHCPGVLWKWERGKLLDFEFSGSKNTFSVVCPARLAAYGLAFPSLFLACVLLISAPDSQIGKGRMNWKTLKRMNYACCNVTLDDRWK